MADSYNPIVAQAILTLSETVAAALDTLGEVVVDRENRVLELMLDASVLFEDEYDGIEGDLDDLDDLDEDELQDLQELTSADAPDADAAAAVDGAMAAAAKMAPSAPRVPSSAESIANLEAQAVGAVATAMNQTLQSVAQLDILANALLADISSMWLDRAEGLDDLADDIDRIEAAVGIEPESAQG